MSTPTPPNGMVSNTELILRHILGEDVTPLPPNSRVEFYLVQVEEYIERLATGATRPIGETTTALTDGATTNPIKIDGEDYTAQINDLVFYGNKEFLFTANGWREVGDLTNLNADMIDDTNTTKKFTNETEKQTWNGKQNQVLGSWTPGTATSHVTPAGTDSVLEALQKIDNNQRNDENNILTDEKYQGGVNLLEYSSLDTTNANGCTYTINADKTITINREESSSNVSYVVMKLDNTEIDVKSLCDGNHYLIGCPTGGSPSTYGMYATGGIFVTDYGSGVLLTDASGISETINVTIRVDSSYQASNITFKPMIITKADYDAGYKGYQPYALSNAELTTKEKQNENNILLKQDKTWIQLKRVTTTSDTFELDLRGKSEFKIVLIHNTDIYEASAPVDLIAAGYKLIVSHINSATPSTDIGTFVYNFSAQGTDDFTATIPSTSYNLLIFAR